MGTMNLKVSSFSYKKGPLVDSSGHGGGFVFDCRCLPNPGREERFRAQTGYDREVIEYLEALPEVEVFFGSVLAICQQAIGNYLQRSFDSLSIAFGCTGGQHRSVYFANRLARELHQKYQIHIDLGHRELKRGETFDGSK
jgi:RNase adaptor protein for sRNA GlmZ degradation